MTSKFVIDEKVLSQLLNYLAGKPYREVADAMNVLQNLPEVTEPQVKNEPGS